MDGSTVTLRRADESELSHVETLLERNGLPSQDVRSKSVEFYLGIADGESVGIVGLETDESDGLLRSLVVERSARGNGFGTALCERVEARAAANDVERLYLLTTTAADFFAGRGYVEIERDAVPDPIRETREFTDLCPATATCLKKSL